MLIGITMSRIAPYVRRLAAKGWHAPSIASAYGVTVRTVLDILRPPPPRPPRPTPQPEPTDPWKSNDWRFKDDVGVELVEHHGADRQFEGIESNAPVPATVPEVARPAPSTWSGPASPCQTSLPGSRRRIKD
jgi:hypothetical protein